MVVAVGALIPLVAFPILRHVGKLSRADSGSIAAHYGSVSVVTFAVGSTYLTRLGEAVEGYMTVFLVLLEFPALVIGALLARRGERNAPWGQVLHEVFAGKSLVLLLGGLAIGWTAGPLDPAASRRWILCSSICSRVCWLSFCLRWALLPPAALPICGAQDCS